MVNQVIYERPKISLIKRVLMYWTSNEVFTNGFTQEHIKKMNVRYKKEWRTNEGNKLGG